MQIGAQIGKSVIPHLKPTFNNSKLKVELQIVTKWYISLGVQQLYQIATLGCKLRCEMGLLNTSLIVLVTVDALGGRLVFN